MASKEEYIAAAKDSKSLSDMCCYLGILPRGANYDTLKHKIGEYKIDVSHFTIIPIIHKNHGKKLLSNNAAKKILVEKFGYKCDNCSAYDWEGNPLTLQVDHIDGNNTNDDIENLRLLCPNCHNETETYCVNVFRPRVEKETYYCACGNEKKSKHSTMCKECSYKHNSSNLKKNAVSVKKIEQKIKCNGGCGRGIKYNSIFCSSCSRLKENKPELPEISEILKMLETSTIPNVARELNVSDGLIRNRVKRYNDAKGITNGI